MATAAPSDPPDRPGHIDGIDRPDRERGPVVVVAYDGIAADEAGVLVSILVEADLPVVVATVAGTSPTSYHGRVAASRTVADLGACRALVVPGGMGVRTGAADPALVGAIARLGGGADWLAASSTGTVLVAASGLAPGARVAAHWLSRSLLIEQGLRPVDQPFVEHGRLLTASGPASAAEIGFRLVGALSGRRAEDLARARHRPPPSDPRYRRPRGSRRWFGRKRAATTVDLDPTGRATVILLELEPSDP